MLNLYQSNMLDALMRLYLATRASPDQFRDPLEPETLLVPSKGMQRWLGFALAQEQGIAANLDFRLPAAFVWQLITRVFPDVPARSPFDREALVWRVLPELPSVLEHEDAAMAANWKAADTRGRYELAWRVTDVFDQYLIYRPDWIRSWEAGKRLGLGADENWQATLWQRLARKEAPHRARLLARLEAALRAGEVPGLPGRLSVFGVSSLPPMYWRLLTALGERTEVDLFLLNPSQEYWGQLKRGDTGEGAHALLASLGQQGRDFINAVAASGINEPVAGHAFVAPQSGSVLAALQSDLLTQTVRTPAEKMCAAADDHSVQIHVCHSPLREIEVLHDQLLMLFQKNPQLMPDDVLVMCSDIQRYAPLVDAVFGTRTQPSAIPYTIADRRLELDVPLLRRFSELLALPGSRFEVERVLALLEEPALLARFELGAGDVPVIRRWCEELHLRWGRDAQDRRSQGLPDDVPLTWRDALSRLLLGFVLPVELAPENDHRFAGRVPAALVFSVSQAQVMARLTTLVERMLFWESQLALPRSLLAWADTLEHLIAAFFAETTESAEALLHLHEVTAELREQARLSESTEPQPFAVLQSWLKRQLQGLESRRGFLHGAVTVCAMVPMRSLPFKVVAVLGLDDGLFPRQQKPWSFDLMAEHAQPGDRSRRQDDRYLFLETLMAARDTLYLSHVGVSDTDGTLTAPSPVLAELMDQLRTTVVFESEAAFQQRFVTRHFLQPFSPEYFRGRAPYFSFSQAFADASQVVGLRTVDGQGGAEQAAFAHALPAPEAALLSVTLPRFERFLSHPVRFFFRERLGVQLAYTEAMLEDEEPVQLTDQRQLRQRLFAQPGLALESLRGEGLLPAGAWGERLFRQEAERMADLHEKVQPWLAGMLAPAAFSLAEEGVTLSGLLTDITPAGIVRVSLEKNIYPTDILMLRLSHLLLCWLAPEGVALQSRLMSADREVVLEPDENPLQGLRDLCAAYAEGMSIPLPLFRQSSPAWAQKQDIHAAQKAYEGSAYARGDAEDAWVRLAWRDADPCDERFTAWADRLYGPLKEALKK
ncbi:MAG: exodeoxyribonuclease V subunit gamma [bacterium]|nr:exodeoxyribonuclease V subunit gamma [bacterium]